MHLQGTAPPTQTLPLFLRPVVSGQSNMLCTPSLSPVQALPISKHKIVTFWDYLHFSCVFCPGDSTDGWREEERGGWGPGDTAPWNRKLERNSQLTSPAKYAPPTNVGTGQRNLDGSRRATNGKYPKCFWVFFLSHSFESCSHTHTAYTHVRPHKHTYSFIGVVIYTLLYTPI